MMGDGGGCGGGSGGGGGRLGGWRCTVKKAMVMIVMMRKTGEVDGDD